MSREEHVRIAPFKSRGQHFLVDVGIARRIVDAVDPQPGESILEVGPGTGALTCHLLDKGVDLTTVEVDRGLAASVRERFGERAGFHLIERDFTKVVPEDLLPHVPVKFISNLPYNVTTPILFKVIDWIEPFDQIVVMMQKEVADRIRSPAGSRIYGRLSVVMALYGKVEFLFKVPPGAFRPKPRVMSGTIRITPFSPRRIPTPYKGSDLETLIRVAFSTRRKRLAKNLESVLNLSRDRVQQAFEQVGLDSNVRAESLPSQTFLDLLEALGPLGSSPIQEGEPS